MKQKKKIRHTSTNSKKATSHRSRSNGRREKNTQNYTTQRCNEYVRTLCNLAMTVSFKS